MDFAFCPVCAAGMTVLSDGPDRGRPACPRGHFVHYDNPAVTAFAFVERAGRYLVLRRAEEPYLDLWDLPGGFVESGEAPAESVQREILEETGLRVESLRVLGAYTSRYGDDGKWTVDVAFHCRALPGDVRLSAEKSQAAWVTPADMPPLAFAGERDALEELRAEQDGLPEDVARDIADEASVAQN